MFARPVKAMTARSTPGARAAGEAPGIVREMLRSSGHPLDAATRNFMEPRFGHDFSRVRIHADTLASRSAEVLAARAFAVGSDIGFRQGEYAPDTDTGRHLLAHELTHALQQGASASASNGELVQRQTDDTLPSNIPAPAPPVFPPSPPPPHVGPDVYICWSPTEAAPIANHSWFRVGGPEPSPDHETFSLYPRLVKQAADGSSCAQGVTFRGAADADISRSGSCLKTPLNYACIETNFSRYPRGLYCPLGPNSNTFTGAVSRACNLPPNIAIPDLVPGFDAQPPQAGTFGPDWTTMTSTGALTCGPKDCGGPVAGSSASGDQPIPEVNVEDLPEAPIPEVNVEDLPQAR